MANQVTLTFAGDSAKLEQAFDKVGASAKTMSTRVAESGDGFRRVGEAADEVDTKAMGFRDTMTGVQDSVKGVSDIAKGDLFTGFLTLGMGVGDLGSAFYNFLVPLAKTTFEFGAQAVAATGHAIALGAHKVATMASTVAQWALNTAFLASPLTWIVLGILLLVGVIILIATKTDWFQKLWKVVWGAIKDAAEAVGRWFTDTLWPWIRGVWDKLVNVVQGIPGKIKAAFSGLFSILTAPYRAAFNFIADAWNNTIGRLSWSVPGWVPGIGGKTISVPHLPHFHAGGVVPGAPGSEMLAVLQAGERVIPAGASGSTAVTLVVAGNGDSALATFLHGLAREGILQFEVAA